jgi:ABC-2 type transport system ATP-binding protein
MEYSVTAKDLTKRFGGFTAVDNISFAVKKGEVYGFLGANGAGKTTAIRMLCGLLLPTSGDAVVAGYSIKKQPDEVKKRLGYMSQKFSLYPILSAKENMDFYAGIYGMTDEAIKKRTPELCALLDLNEVADRPVGDLPGGLKQRVSLACAVAHGPEIVFLDEPTAGVDPLLRRRFWEIIKALSDAGTTVFVTTHYMDEVEHCNRIALMHSGKIIKEGTIPELKRSVFGGPLVEIEAESPVQAYEILSAEKQAIGDVSIHGALLHIIPSRGTDETKAGINRILAAANMRFSNPEEVEPTMDDVFVNTVKQYEKGGILGQRG